MGRKLWNIIPYDKKRASALAKECGADDFAVLLLASRGIDSAEKIKAFLSCDANGLSSPFLLKDMDKAVERIRAAIDRGEKILVYGDYDADGVTATALLFSYLESTGAQVEYYIPSRLEDGYGLSLKTAEKIVEGEIELVITVDNGIAAIDEAAFLKENGIDLIVTDHHKTGEILPEAVAVINPQRENDCSPEKNPAGVGVALKLAAALEDGDYGLILEDYADIAAIGTIADVVPLTGENRIIASAGLKAIENTSRAGLCALLEKAGFADREINAAAVAYGIAPRINAAGRMDSADKALELLITEDFERAQELADEINAANAARQSAETEISDETEKYFKAFPKRRLDRVLVISGKNWHPGVIGIAASRLVEKYGRPAIVISTDESGKAKGSGRSIDGFSLFDALSAAEDTLIQFGGHTLAAGFSIEESKIELFREKINRYAAERNECFPSLNIDCRLNPANISADILDSLALLEPFGAKNPPPVFGLFNMCLDGIKPIGGNRHIRLSLSRQQSSLTAVMFGQTAESFPFKPGDNIDIAVKIEKNEYMGERRLSLQIKDIRPAGCDDKALFGSLSAYLSFARGDSLSETQKNLLCPDRALISAVYRIIKESGGKGLTPELFCMKMKADYSKAGAVSIALDALENMALIEKRGEEYSLSGFSGKVNLADCELLKALGY